MFSWDRTFFANAPIDHEVIGTLGDFFGGVLGSIWSLCGVLLFYTALKEQRRDFKINENALNKQIEALSIQTKEFELQRIELSQTRQVFREQSLTLRQQRLESTYFSMLGIYKNIITDLNEIAENKSYFKSLKQTLYEKYTTGRTPQDNHATAKNIYLEVFYEKKEELNHYFKIIYRILRIIEDADVSEQEKFRYVKILRSQLSENEMLAMYYNSHSPSGEKVYKLILKYNLLKHLPLLSKLEFLIFICNKAELFKGHHNEIGNKEQLEKNQRLSLINRFNNELTGRINNFLSGLSSHLKSDEIDDDSYKVSFHLPFCKGVLIALEATEYHEATIKIINTSLKSSEINLLYFSENQFIDYMKAFLYDVFIFSRYIETPEDFITIDKANNVIEFNLRLSKKLELNKDFE